MSEIESNSKIMRTSNAEAALTWNAVLEFQVAAYFPYELSFYFQWPEWQAASCVLDAGCGNGYFLSQLVRYFSDKSFTGIDISRQLIDAARTNEVLRDVELIQTDLLTLDSKRKFDIVLLRLIVQHLDGLDRLFDQLDRLVAPRGQVLIVEPEPRLFFNYPRLPKFEQLLVSYAGFTARAKLNRSSLDDLSTGLARFRNWSISQDKTYVAPVLGPFKNTPLMQTLSLWIDLFERTQGFDFPISDVRREVADWSQQSETFSQVGIRFIVLTRKA